MMYGTMDGMPVRITAGSAVQRRPEYLDPLVGPGSDSILAEQAMMMPTEDTFMPSFDPELDASMMTVSAAPAEGKKDSNFARIFGVSLLVLGIGLAMRKK
jgi:hypothetical protein